MSSITTHVLDTSTGRPGGGVGVTLERRMTTEDWEMLGKGITDADGRLKDLLPPGLELQSGEYRLTFETGLYFRSRGTESFFPQVTIGFEVKDAGQHYHVPLLLSPFGYSTYRGS